jgi:hypothetical protein
MNIEKLLYRILLGYYYIFVHNKKYKIINPSVEIKYEAEILYDQIIEENKFDKTWLTEKEIKFYLNINNIWNDKKEDQLKEYKKAIDNIKIDIYLNFHNDKQFKYYCSELKSVVKQIEFLENEKNCMSHLDIKTHATNMKQQFIILNTIYSTETNQLYFDPYSEFNDNLSLQKFIQEITDNIILPQDIRSLAKSDIWKIYSLTSKLEQDILNVNDEYKYLIHFDKMYDNVRQHPDCPSEDIIQYDDALDGWFIFQNRKAEKEKKKKSILDKIDNNTKNNKGEHVFLFTGDKKEAQDIHELNDLKTQKFIEEVFSYSKNNPDTKWQDIPAVKQKLEQEAREKLGIKK